MLLMLLILMLLMLMMLLFLVDDAHVVDHDVFAYVDDALILS